MPAKGVRATIRLYLGAASAAGGAGPNIVKIASRRVAMKAGAARADAGLATANTACCLFR